MKYKAPITQYLDGDHLREGDEIFNELAACELEVIAAAQEVSLAQKKLHEARSKSRALRFKLQEEYLLARYLQGHKVGFAVGITVPKEEEEDEEETE